MEIDLRIQTDFQTDSIGGTLAGKIRAFPTYRRSRSYRFFHHGLRAVLWCFSLVLGAQTLAGQTLAFGAVALDFNKVRDQPDQLLERQEWITSAVSLLKTKSPADRSIRLYRQAYKQVGYRKIFYALNSEQGYIPFPKGGWLYLLVHSEHSNEAIGDITLAIDHRGMLYINEGHICGGTISFFTDEVARIKSVADFIRYCKADTDNKPWATLEE